MVQVTKTQLTLPEGFEITKCKPSRRGKRSRDLKLTARPKPRTLSWEEAEVFARDNPA